MAAPSTVDEFVELIRKSGVLDETRLFPYVQKLKDDSATPNELSGLAGLFVRDGLLTYFQAEQFLQGRWKRFTIGKYKVLEKIGTGGMGQVFLCEHKLMRRRVAVKVLPAQKAADPSSLDRFYREARAVAALDHINIVRAYDIDQDANLHFLVMEYVDGANMQEMIRKSKRMDVTRACHYMYWSAVGLQHAHTNGLIHRDIKPGNILVDRTGVVKILDLGLARFFNDDEDLLTKKYDETVLGTADYLAPEQAIDSHGVDGRADIYSLGATFYFLLSGSPPFAEGTIAQKLLWHQTRMPKPIREIRPEVPESVATVLEKMMAKKPEDRFATPGQLAEALLPFTQTPIGPPPEDEMPRLSAAAQGTASGPVAISVVPRTIVTAPLTPMPSHGSGKAPTPDPSSGSLARAHPITSVAEADTQRNRPVPVVEPFPDSTPGTPIWEVISAETASSRRADTDRTKRDQSSRRVKNKPVDEKPVEARKVAPKSEKRLGKKTQSSMGLIFLLVAGVILISGGAVAAYWFGFREKSKPSAPGATEPRTLYLTKNPGGAPLHYPSLQKAVADFKTGDTIVIKDDEWEDIGAVTRTKGLILQAAEGKQVIWRVPSSYRGSKEEGVLLTLYDTEGAWVSGITFDCGGLVANAVKISGHCPDLILEKVAMLNATQAALLIYDCVGLDNRPATIRRCRFANSGGKESKSGVLFAAAPLRSSRNVLIQNCTLEGRFTAAAFQFEGPAAAIEIKHCRVWNVGNGVWFRKSTSEKTAIWQVNIEGNTFYSTTGSALRFEEMNQPKSGTGTRITLAQNLFTGKSPMDVGLFDQVALANIKNFLVAIPNNNVYSSGIQLGSMPANILVSIPEADAVVSLNPTEPASFLMYDKSSKLFKAAVNGKPAGVPPE